jgi:hypothetical protein
MAYAFQFEMFDNKKDGDGDSWSKNRVEVTVAAESEGEATAKAKELFTRDVTTLEEVIELNEDFQPIRGASW